MDVRLHAKFDDMQKEQRGKSKLPETAANAKFPLAGEIHDVLEQRLDGAHPMWDEGDCAKDRYTLTVRKGLGDDYGSVFDNKVDALFGDKSEVTKEEWKALSFDPFENGEHDIKPEAFDAIWAKVHTDANGNAPKLSDIPDNAKLTKDEVRGLANEKL